MTTNTETIEDGLRLVSVSDSLDRLGGISREKFYDLVRSGQIEVVKIGRRTFVISTELDRFILELAGTA